jgi:hypothetical protein
MAVPRAISPRVALYPMNTADRRSRGYSRIFGLLLGCVAMAGCQSTTGTNSMVSVRAQADRDWAAHQLQAASDTSAATKPAPTYVFTRGRFFPSEFDDKIKPLDFGALTSLLATGLNTRFTPAERIGDADFVVVVHWGAVVRPENSMDTLMYDPDSIRQASEAVDNARTQAAADFKAGNYLAYGQVHAAESNLANELQVADAVFSSDARVKASTADLIGLRGLYRSDDTTVEAEAARSLLEDDRYFVTLLAFDAQLLKLKQKRVVWSARMSAPVAGRDFETAVRQMNAVAAPYYGTQQNHLVLQVPSATVAETMK